MLLLLPSCSHTILHLPLYLSLSFSHCITANQRELVSDFLRKAKQLEYLINSLPSSSTTDQEDETEFNELEKEMREVNGEYEEALRVAGELSLGFGGRKRKGGEADAVFGWVGAEGLHAEIQASLRQALDARTIPPPS